MRQQERAAPSIHPLDLTGAVDDLQLMASDVVQSHARRAGTFSSFGTLGSVGGCLGTASTLGCVAPGRSASPFDADSS